MNTKFKRFQRMPKGPVWTVALLVLAANLSWMPPVFAFTATGSLAAPRTGFTTTLLPNGKILIAGGYDDTNQLSSAELYDSATGSWAATAAMHSSRAAHTATLLPNGKVLVAGGYDGTNRLASAELYDPPTGTWTPTRGLLTGRSVHTATLLRNGTVLIAGGANDSAQLDTAELYDPATGTWTTAGSMTGSRAGHTATLLPSGRVFVTGGEGSASPWSAEIYDPVTRTWAATGDMSHSRSEHTATLLPDGKVLVAGGGWYESLFGYTSTAAAELYDPGTGIWTETGSFTDARLGHVASLLPNGQVLVTGGVYQGSGGVTTLLSAELYDPVAGTWSSAGDMTVARLYHSATLLPSGRVLIAAGFNYRDNDLSSAELYDATSGSWTGTGWMNSERRWHSATLLANGKVLVTGGIAGLYPYETLLADSELYDPATGAWAPTGPLNLAHGGRSILLDNGKVLLVGANPDGQTIAELYDPTTETWTLADAPPTPVGTVTLLANGLVLVAGGSTNGYYAVASAQLYDPTTGLWTPTRAMNIARVTHTATLLPNGKVLVAGGLDSAGGLGSSAELYDPVTGGWSLTGPMNFTRRQHTATLLPNGKVLVVGDAPDGASQAWSDAELYDPANGTWTVTGRLNFPRGRQTATLLPNGLVLIAGGYQEYRVFPGGSTGGEGSASAELYDPATGLWTITSDMADGREWHTATLLPGGQVLVVGGWQVEPFLAVHASAELYDPGLGFDASLQPQISAVTSSLSLGSGLVISGSGFRGISEASGGNGCQSSASDFPLVQLRSLETGQTAFLAPTNWSETSFASVPLSGFSPGFAAVTVFVNGVPSMSSILNITVPVLTAPILTGPRQLPNGSFQFSFTNAPGALFGIVATTNLALPTSKWTALGAATEIAPGQFQFTDTQAMNIPKRFYRVSSP